MRSSPAAFGPEKNLVGIASGPDRSVEHDVAFLLFNSGVLPRVGPHRINVRIAQRLAQLGHFSFRFDLSGQGDSRPASGMLDYRAQAVADVRAAMDHVESTMGIKRFALIGLCSGAMNSHSAALADERVVGLLMFDGYWYRTRWSRPFEYWKRIRSTAWSEIFAKLWRRIARRSPATARAALVPGLFEVNGDSANPPKAQFAESLQRLVNRGVAVCIVYSGSILDYVSYSSQFQHAFSGWDFVSRVRATYRPDIDHMFLLRETQDRMIELVVGWMPEVLRPGGCEK